LKGFVKRCCARKPEMVLNQLQEVMGTQVTVEHVERPKPYRSLKEIEGELARFGMKFDTPALSYYRGPGIVLDAEEIKDAVDLPPAAA
jgi:hypothetical protein